MPDVGGNLPTSEPRPAEDDRSALDAGLQVGLGGPQATIPPAAARAPSWAVPMIVLALVAGLGAGFAIGLLVGGRDGSGQAATTTAVTTTTAAWDPGDAYGGPVTVSGDPLPMLSMTAGQADAALGLPLPEITGTDFAGNPVSLLADGRPKLIVALAHWCPYCNAELPILMDWYAAGVPEEVAVVSLHVFADPSRSNFPPAAWLRAAGWTLPLIADDERRTLSTALGIPAVPFWLLVSADGTVLVRTTGQRDAAFLDAAVAALLETASPTTTVP